MNRVLLFGASGNIGRALAAELSAAGYSLTVVVRSREKMKALGAITDQYRIADAGSAPSLQNICSGFDIVVSALGKSVSMNDRGRDSFREVDEMANANILSEALRNRVKKFLYISVLGADRLKHLQYFGSHYAFEERLRSSGIDYTIVRPPAVFSSFKDLVEMASKGRLMTLGRGDKKTNPIHERDLARIAVEGLQQRNALIEAGGKEVLTRRAINELIQAQVNPSRRVRSVPLAVATTALPAVKLFDRNLYDKLAFYLEVLREDTLAPQLGDLTLEDWLMEQPPSPVRSPLRRLR